MLAWSDIETSPEYQEADDRSRLNTRGRFFQDNIINDPDFQALPMDEQDKVATQFVYEGRPEQATQEESFFEEYNTELPEEMKTEYGRWLADQSSWHGRDIEEDKNWYDLQGYYMSGAWQDRHPDAPLPAKFAKPNHPDFDENSQYFQTAQASFAAANQPWIQANISDAIQTTEQLWQGLAAGSASLGESFGIALEYAGRRLPPGVGALNIVVGKKISEYFEKERKAWSAPKELQGSVWDNPRLLSKGAWWAYNVAQMAPQLLGGMAPGLVAGKGIQIAGQALKWSPALIERLARIGIIAGSGVGGGVLEATQTYKSVLENGGSEEEAARAAELMGLGAAGLNSLGYLGILGRRLGFKGLQKGAAVLGAAGEGITESLEEPWEELSKAVAKYLTTGDMPKGLLSKMWEAWKKEGLTVMGPAMVTGGGTAIAAGEGRAPTKDEILGIEQVEEPKTKPPKEEIEAIETKPQEQKESIEEKYNIDEMLSGIEKDLSEGNIDLNTAKEIRENPDFQDTPVIGKLDAIISKYEKPAEEVVPEKKEPEIKEQKRIAKNPFLVKTKEGEVYKSKAATTHADLLDEFNLKQKDIADTGFLVNGKEQWEGKPGVQVEKEKGEWIEPSKKAKELPTEEKPTSGRWVPISGGMPTSGVPTSRMPTSGRWVPISGGMPTSGMPTSGMPTSIKKILEKPAATETEVKAEKTKLKSQVIEGVKAGTFTGAVRFGTVDELNEALKTGKLPVSGEYDEIHAQPIMGKDDDAFAAYGAYDKHNMAIVIPEQYVQGKPDAHTKEVVIDPKAKLEDMKFMVDGHEKVYSYDELKKLIGKKKLEAKRTKAVAEEFKKGIDEAAKKMVAIKEKVPKNFREFIISKGHKWEEVSGKNKNEKLLEKLRAEFNKFKEQKPQYAIAPAQKAPPFYSQLLRAVETAKDMPRKVQSLIKWLQRKQVKPAEMKWMDVEQWLKENQKDGKIDRQAFLDFLKANQIEIKENILTNESVANIDDWYQYLLDNKFISEEENLTQDDIREIVAEEKALGNIDEAALAKYSDYQLPGGKGYRELIFSLPRGERYPEQSHYPEDTLMWVRFNERTDADGNRVLFIEEIQSDWLQAAKEKGFGISEEKKRLFKERTEAINRQETINRKVREEADKKRNIAGATVRFDWFSPEEIYVQLGERYWKVLSTLTSDKDLRRIYDVVTQRAEYKDFVELQKQYKDTRAMPEPPMIRPIPKAPFLENWHEYAMKRMLRWAAENGFDKVAWTKGRHQIRRYEEKLRQEVDEIRWKRDNITRREYAEKPTSEPAVFITAFKNGNEKFSEFIPLEGTTNIAGKEVELKDVVGKPLAQQIVQSSQTSGTFKGEDLSIGGMGMRSFYDELLPGFLRKYGKQWGAKVGEATISTIDASDIGMYDLELGEEVSGEDAIIKDAVNSIDITPEMKKSVIEKGQPQYALKGEKRGPQIQERLMPTPKTKSDRIASLERALSKDLNRQIPPGTLVEVGATTPQRGITKKAAKAFGVDAIFFKSKDKGLDAIEGATMPWKKRTVYINANSSRPVMVIAGHELTHSLRNNYPDLHDFLRKSILDNTIDIHDFIKKRMSAEEVAGFEEAQAIEYLDELIGDFAGEQFGNKDFWNKLEDKSPTLTRRLIRVVQGILGKIKKAISGSKGAERYIKDVDKAQTVLTDVMGEFSRRQLARKVKAKREGDQYGVYEFAQELPAQYAVKKGKELDQFRDTIEGAELAEGMMPEAGEGMPMSVEEFMDGLTKETKKAEEKIKGFDKFKKWFGKSKVVDENGEPLVVYHWTDYEFEAFSIDATGGLIHFGTKRAASKIAGGKGIINYDIEKDGKDFWVYADSGPMDGEGQGPFKSESEAKYFIETQPKEIEPIAVYLNLQNPLRVPDFGVWTMNAVREYLNREGIFSDKEADQIWKAWQKSDQDGYEVFNKTLAKHGYDGFVYTNEQEDVGRDSYVAIKPTQIKSIFNRGTWSAEDPRISYAISKEEAKKQTKSRQAEEYLKKFKTSESKSTADALRKAENAKSIKRPKEPSAYEALKDDWFGEKDWAVHKHSVEAGLLQDSIKHALGKKRYDKEAKDIDAAIHIYLDLKRNPGHYKKYAKDLTEEQKRIARLAKKVYENPKLKKIAQYIEKQYQKLGQLAFSEEVIYNVIDNYVGRAWNIEGKAAAETFRKFGTKTRHAKHRVFETILEGQAKGFKLAVEGATNNLALVQDEIARTIEDKKLMKKLMKEKWLDTDLPMISDTKLNDEYDKIEHPNFTAWKFATKADLAESKVDEATKLKEGDFVRRSDRNKLGKIVGITDDAISVHFINKKKGTEETISFSKEMITKKGALKKVQPKGMNFIIMDDGTVLEKRSLYAPKKIAQNLNRILGQSALKGKLKFELKGKEYSAIDILTKYNAGLKSLLLMTGFFHHQAFMRSYSLGTRHKSLKEWRNIKAYKEGIKAIKEFKPEIELLVRNGLTLGRIQDWEESILQQEETIIDKILEKGKYSKAFKEWVGEMRRRQADFLFRNFGAGLKASAALIEYRNALKEHPEMEPNERAKLVANLMNDDFGGLHLGRIGRSPTGQHIFRLLALAPDWTESNVRSMYRAFVTGDKARRSLYRKFWTSILTKGIGATLLTNLLLSSFDDDDYWSKLKKSWKEGNLRWLDVDITPLYRALYKAVGDTPTDARKYFSIFGHFKDPLKFALYPIRSAHHKGSVLYRMLHELTTGMDWRGQGFTSFWEFLGVDDKGIYVTSRKGKYKKGEPKGGKMRFKLTDWRTKTGPVGFEKMPSYAMHQLRGFTPIQIQNLMSWISGEQEGFDAIMRALGIHYGTTYPNTKKSTESFVQEYIDAANDRIRRVKLQNEIDRYNKRAIAREDETIPWQKIVKKGNNILNATRMRKTEKNFKQGRLRPAFAR